MSLKDVDCILAEIFMTRRRGFIYTQRDTPAVGKPVVDHWIREGVNRFCIIPGPTQGETTAHPFNLGGLRGKNMMSKSLCESECADVIHKRYILTPPIGNP